MEAKKSAELAVAAFFSLAGGTYKKGNPRVYTRGSFFDSV
jgi:hypothetical protein